MKGKKLPDVWIVFNANGVPISVEFLDSDAKRTAIASDTIRRYVPTPTKKPKAKAKKVTR